MTASVSWDPERYLAFESERLRPALDLLARIPLANPREIADLGCGAGNVSAYLLRRFPDAHITGVDSSAEMLAQAAATLPDATWLKSDIATWEPEARPDLIYSNAALHWIPNHAEQFPRLLDRLARNGVLAVQMPQSRHGIWRDTLRVVAAEGPWAGALSSVIGPGNVLSASEYYRLLSPRARRLDIWESEYLHNLQGDDPVAAWTQGAGLRPALAALDAKTGAAFYEAYRLRLRQAYMPEVDGRTLFPFRRLFVVAGL